MKNVLTTHLILLRTSRIGMLIDDIVYPIKFVLRCYCVSDF